MSLRAIARKHATVCHIIDLILLALPRCQHGGLIIIRSIIICRRRSMLHIQLLFILLKIADNGLDPSVAAIIKIILDFARREFFHQVVNIRYRLADGIETDMPLRCAQALQFHLKDITACPYAICDIRRYGDKGEVIGTEWRTLRGRYKWSVAAASSRMHSSAVTHFIPVVPRRREAYLMREKT